MEAFALSPDAVRVPLPQRLLSDDRLLRLVAAGNPQAFGAVYARYHAPLYAYCRSIVRDPDDAKDALQNTMVKALAALGRGEDRELPLKPWLFRIAHNESVSLLRRRRPSEPLTDALSPPVPGVEAQAAARERLSQLVADLQELPERQRSALIMREVNGLSYEEIAAALAISPGAARQTVFEARTALAEYGEGREVACDSIRRSISDGDGRAMRARRVRAHLRSCNACRDFQSTMRVRRRELHLLAPGMSGGAAVALLQGVMGAGAVSGGAVAGGGAGLLGGSASALLASGAAKGVVALVAVSAVGAGAMQVAGPSKHHARRAAVATAASASGAGPSARAAASGHEATGTAVAALSGQGFSPLPGAGTTGSGHHRTAGVLAHSGVGLSVLPGDLVVSAHSHHGGGSTDDFGQPLPGAGLAAPPRPGYGHHHGSMGATDDPTGDAPAPDDTTGDSSATTGGGYTGWAGTSHHHRPAPAPAPTGDSSGDGSASDGGDSTGDGSSSGASYDTPWHSRSPVSRVPSTGSVPPDTSGDTSGAVDTTSSADGSSSSGGYTGWHHHSDAQAPADGASDPTAAGDGSDG